MKPYEAQKIPNVADLAHLFREGTLANPEGELLALEKQCRATMKEVEEIAKEVGGDASTSTRYQYASEIVYHIKQLERIKNGTYTFTSGALTD